MFWQSLKQKNTKNFKVPWNPQKFAGKAILNSSLLHGTLCHPTKFQVHARNSYRFITGTSSIRPGPSLSQKIQSSMMECEKFGRTWPFFTKTCFMALSISHLNFRSTSDIVGMVASFRMDRWPTVHMESRQYLLAPKAAKGRNEGFGGRVRNNWQLLLLSSNHDELWFVTWIKPTS